MDKIALEYAEQLRLSLKEHIKKIILFGSRSRGDYTEGSDYDFAVILDKRNKNMEDIVDEVSGNLLNKYSVLFGPIIWDENEWLIKKKYPIGINILKDGIEL